MYQYIWDADTGGLLLTSEISKFSKEPRPVYYRELDILGFDKHWSYPKDDSAPLMWAEANNYIYRGRTVARVKGGSLYTPPELILLEEPEPPGESLQFVDVEAMCRKNKGLMEALEQETIQTVYNTYREYKDKVDIFYVAFSGGKDSVVALNIVQKALPHDEFIVLFGDTGMEFSDTYATIDSVAQKCQKDSIRFYKAKSKLDPQQTWKAFGPPATTNRWCCSVHKTTPQIIFLRKYLRKKDFRGMAFTGVRAEESLGRSGYEKISEGKKHSGQRSCHCLLEWNSAEIFLDIYSNKLALNDAYKKGISRAGCLVCPNSTGKHEYLKRVWYKDRVDTFVDAIASTSGKTNYSEKEMKHFIESGYWRTRRSGRELNVDQDYFELKLNSSPPSIIVYKDHFELEKWLFTIGDYSKSSDVNYLVKFSEKLYEVEEKHLSKTIQYIFKNCRNEKNDIKFISLFKGVVIKGLYCVNCGVCEAECNHDCIDMTSVSSGVCNVNHCTHCQSCHNIHEHCLRYNSIRSKRTEGKLMAKIDRYFTFGVRNDWLNIYCKYNGDSAFWDGNGDGAIGSKKKDAFKAFVLDSELAIYDKKAVGDKYTKCIPTHLTEIVKRLGVNSETAWGLILCNLVYTPAFGWFVETFKNGEYYTPDLMKELLSNVMENDLKGLGKRNVVDSFKITMAKTPLGTAEMFAKCDITVKRSGMNERVTLNSFTRATWENPVPEVILYSLYKFAEACGGIYQFTLHDLMDDTVERDGISPTRIFGLDELTMAHMLNGLSVNYPDFINASFTLDLDKITLRRDKTSADVLQLF